MEKFLVQGGNRLSGTIDVQGSKNEAFQVICAALMTDESVTLHNVPNISDINVMLNLLEIIGVVINRKSSRTLEIIAKNICKDALNEPLFIEYSKKIRGSALLMAPLLSINPSITLPKPGGDKIGRRPINIHLDSLKSMGATVSYDSKSLKYTISVQKFIGTSLFLEEASVTGTATTIMAAVLAQGTSTIYNAACEPYLLQLCLMLNKMGAKISGIGSNLLIIKGVNKLHGVQHNIMPDIIEIGTFIGLAAATKSNITINAPFLNTPFLNTPTLLNKSYPDDFIAANSCTHKSEKQNFKISTKSFIKETLTDELITKSPHIKKNEKIGFDTSTFSDEIYSDVFSYKNILRPIIKGFSKIGVDVVINNNEIEVPAKEHYCIKSYEDGTMTQISDRPWPGFPPDLISIAIVTAINATGTILVKQRMFESRLFFVDFLLEMGAHVVLCDPHRAVVTGLNGKGLLYGTKIKTPDIRAGLALLIATLTAKGESIIENIEQIDRGYENIEERLNAIGANIQRISC